MNKLPIAPATAAKAQAHRSRAQSLSRARPMGAPCAARAQPLDRLEHASTIERPAAASLPLGRPLTASVARFVSGSALRLRLGLKLRLRLRSRSGSEPERGPGTKGEVTR